MTKVKHEMTQEEHDLMFEEYEREVGRYRGMYSTKLRDEIQRTKDQIRPLRKQLLYQEAALRIQEKESTL